MDYGTALLLGFVEGITEYLPISSTGHLVLTSSFLGIAQDPFVKSFTVMVQLGAILAVLTLYWRRFLKSALIYQHLAIAFLPVAIVGYLLHSKIDELLGSVLVVAWAMILGGIALIWAEKIVGTKSATSEGLENRPLSNRQALVIGLCQCLALIPGVSRSAATLLGGVGQGLTRREAAEFSFLLALPTLSAATLFKFLKIFPTLSSERIGVLFLGNFVSFIVGWAVIKGFLIYLQRFGFRAFGWYRIVVGGMLLILIYSGVELHLL